MQIHVQQLIERKATSWQEVIINEAWAVDLFVRRLLPSLHLAACETQPGWKGRSCFQGLSWPAPSCSPDWLRCRAKAHSDASCNFSHCHTLNTATCAGNGGPHPAEVSAQTEQTVGHNIAHEAAAQSHSISGCPIHLVDIWQLRWLAFGICLKLQMCMPGSSCLSCCRLPQTGSQRLGAGAAGSELLETFV